MKPILGNACSNSSKNLAGILGGQPASRAMQRQQVKPIYDMLAQAGFARCDRARPPGARPAALRARRRRGGAAGRLGPGRRRAATGMGEGGLEVLDAEAVPAVRERYAGVRELTARRPATGTGG